MTVLRFGYFSSCVALCLLLTAASFALAQTTTPATTTASSTELEMVAERADATVDQVATERAALAAQPRDETALSATERARIRNLAANLSNRHEAAITRLTRISERLERALAQHSAPDQNNNAARALTVADQALAAAATTLSTIDADVHAFVYSPEPQTDWQRVRSIYTLSAQSINDARIALRISLNELRNLESPTP